LRLYQRFQGSVADVEKDWGCGEKQKHRKVDEEGTAVSLIARAYLDQKVLSPLIHFLNVPYRLLKRVFVAIIRKDVFEKEGGIAAFYAEVSVRSEAPIEWSRRSMESADVVELINLFPAFA
jgi:hypothetical protein